LQGVPLVRMIILMPSKNSLKIYSEESFYHIYNRGVEKRTIFLDEQDYSVFLSYLKNYLLPKDEINLRKKLSDPYLSFKEKDKILKLIRLNNFNGEISLIAYCLMPNHFHMLLYQKGAATIDKFMNSLGTRYSMYFNRKYKRVGSLYQDVYKAVAVTSDEQLLHLTRYIHKQALALQGDALVRREGQPCSFPEYIGKRNSEWIKPDDILLYFSKTNPNLDYKSFVMAIIDLTFIRKVILDDH